MAGRHGGTGPQSFPPLWMALHRSMYLFQHGDIVQDEMTKREQNTGLCELSSSLNGPLLGSLARSESGSDVTKLHSVGGVKPGQVLVIELERLTCNSLPVVR